MIKKVSININVIVITDLSLKSSTFVCFDRLILKNNCGSNLLNEDQICVVLQDWTYQSNLQF